MEALMRKRVETGDAPEIVADTVLKAATDTAPPRHCGDRCRAAGSDGTSASI